MKEDNAVKESLISPEDHARFIKSFIAGKPDYDMLMNWIVMWDKVNKKKQLEH